VTIRPPTTRTKPARATKATANGARQGGPASPVAQPPVAAPPELRPGAPRPRRGPDYRLRGLDLGPDVHHAPARPRRRNPRRRRGRRVAIYWAILLVAAALVAVALRLFVVEPFSVPSAAMAPTFQSGDRILVMKPELLTGAVSRGDIVVFRHPDSPPCSAHWNQIPDLVTRVIGLPGETIWSTGRSIYVNGHRLRERGWYDQKSGPLGSTPITPTTIPAGDYFVLGDNRSDACDSRAFGAIPGSSIVGKVIAIVARGGHPHIQFI
jgi:signal peptidase I